MPDPYCDSLPGFLRKGRALIRELRPDALISIAYPWTAHLAAAILARWSRTPWIAEYGDPWTGNPASGVKIPRWRKFVDQAIERLAVRSAAVVVVTTDATKRHYLGQFPCLKDKIEVIRIGYQPLPPTDRGPAGAPRRDCEKLIHILHAGRVYRGARSPEELLKALQRLQADFPDLESRLLVTLVGEVDDLTREQVVRWNLNGVVRLLGWKTRAELSSDLQRTDLLLLLANRGGMQVPSKLYEYLGAGRPILALFQPSDDEAAGIVRKCDAGWTVHDDADSIYAFLRSLLDSGMAGVRFERRGVSEYTAEFQLKRYGELVRDMGRWVGCEPAGVHESTR